MKYFYKPVLLAWVLLLSSATVFGQFTIEGTVTGSSDNAPLEGASVAVKGTTTGAFTKSDGKFKLEVPGQSGTLIVSFVGYARQEVAISSANPTVRISLIVDNLDLDEVIITGYGSQTRGSITGSISQLRGDQIEQVPLASFEQTLQGNVAGVQALMSNGQPGANVSVQIRGQGSISASSQPLYVIDGIPVASGNLTFSAETSNPLATMNPNDIESVTVLKDAASTAIYGSRGANGVILIRTKSGKPGQAKIDFRTQWGSNDWAISDKNRLRGLTATEYTDLYIEGYKNRNGEDLETTINRFNGQFPDPQTGLPAVDIIPDASNPLGYRLGEVRVDTRWLDELSRSGLNQSYDLSVSGGDAKSTYFISGSYFSQEAPVIGSNLERLTGRANLSVQATDKLKITNNINISRTTQQGMRDATAWTNPLYNGYLLAPVIPIKDAQGLYYAGHKGFFMGGNNPVGSLSGDDVQDWSMIRILNNISGEYEIVKGLLFKSAWSFDILNYSEFYFKNSRYGDGRNVGGIGRESNRNILNWIGTQTLTYVNTFADKHNITALAGYEANKSGTRSVSTTALGYPNPNLRTLANAANPDLATSDLSEFAFNSIFSQVNYNFSEKYYLSGSIRRDGSSRFGVNNRYGLFWSVGAAWRIDQENFMNGVDFIDELKLRSSYGATGNAGIDNYEHLPSVSYNGFEYDGSPGGAPGNIGNADLTWERSTTFNVGLDFSLFGRFNGIVEYFDRESDNLLLDVPISRTTGFASLPVNLGSMKNSGVELTLNLDIIPQNGDNFYLNIGGNVTWLKNRITNLDEEFIDGTKIRREGRDYQSFYTVEWAGVDPANGDPLWFTDSLMTETTNRFSDAKRFESGLTATPSAFGGFNISTGLKGFSVYAQFVHSWDMYLYDATAWVIQGDGRFTPRSQTNLTLERWQNPGDETNVPKFAWGNTSGSNSRNSTRWVHDGTHIRLRNLTVAYNVPSSFAQKIGLRSLRVYARGVNMFTWTREKGLYLDPEAAFSGVVNSPVPNLKTISGGIDIGI